ncbi:uncharacterized protein DNG_07168 [Cephalotrichum gorgonifer]|uniref:DUF676 domain-containing protein n=1 Tax=Cephalotrichum gorgonifer TaxID=2041049 RepID=A0AAE8SX77_9PEZI|nr:uncharacterized protein DNG_07168 [Cephalotrichum gorgonifer]
MKKTLLLVFIHGFKGGESTFGDDYQFTRDLRDSLAKELPKINVKVLVYPKYETRGDLGECVSRFTDWLLEKVIDLEVDAGTPSPTVDPSVRTVLIGHSMGGIVAAETLIRLTSEKPIHAETALPSDDGAEGDRPLPPLSGLMFPYIQGILTFDTPFLGISPGVVAHGAEDRYNDASAALGALTSIWGGATAAKSSAANTAPKAALPAPPAAASDSGWGKWGRVAMYAGAASAIAGSAAAAYVHRDNITQGLSWVSSHLEFVGCLARAEDLRRRVEGVVRAGDELGVGFANLYTRLGPRAGKKNVGGVVGTVLGPDRTFCNLPRGRAGVWKEAVNSAAGDETIAHMTMFEPKNNPGYKSLLKDATALAATWVGGEWYESSSEPALNAGGA